MGPLRYSNMRTFLENSSKARRRNLQPLEVWPGEPVALAAEERMGICPDAMFNTLPYLGDHKALGWGRVRVLSESEVVLSKESRYSSKYNKGFGAYHVGKKEFGAQLSPMEFVFKIEAGLAYGIIAGDAASYYVAVFKRINRKAKGQGIQLLLDID